MLETVIREVIDAEPPAAQDAAVVELALTYACGIDAGGDLSKLGPALLACLEALHMSPRARNAARKAVTDDKPVANPLDQLAGRRARRGRAEGVDATAS